MGVLEDVKTGAVVQGIVPGLPAEVISIDWIGDQAINVVYRARDGSIAETTLYRDDEPRLTIVSPEVV